MALFGIIKKMHIVALLFVFLFVITAPPVGSQTSPIFLVTWSADSYVAPLFEGRPLPTTGTPVSVAFELVENGRFVSLGAQEVRWFLGGTLAQKSAGGKTFAFTARGSVGAHQLRIELPNFRGGQALSKSIQIP